MALKFYYNGIKDNGGKLQRCSFSMGPLISDPIITICKRDHVLFSEGVRKVFIVQNNSDLQTDYFETDRIRVHQAHPLYAQVKEAHDKGSQR